MPWLSAAAYRQSSSEAITALPKLQRQATRFSFRHIVHVYDDAVLPINTAVQAITFRTMLNAKQVVEKMADVTCIAVTFSDDAHLVPTGIVHAPVLSRMVGDVARFTNARPLPLLFDVLDLGLAAGIGGAHSDENEFIIFTNSDIHLQPNFYVEVAQLLEQGWQAMSINRRTLDVPIAQRRWDEKFFSEPGQAHPGFDCFVFPASWYARFARSLSCCGASYVMRSLLFNLIAQSSRYLFLDHAHLTFHLGDDRKWEVQSFDEYRDFNEAQAMAVIEAIAVDTSAFARLRDFIRGEADGPFKRLVNRLA